MASNNGARLTVFGLGYRQHDTRKMHRILDHYERLPNNANDRVALYTTLTALARDIPDNEAQSIENWLASGGEFPFQRAFRQPVFHGGGGFGGNDWDHDDEDEGRDAGRQRPRHPARGGTVRDARPTRPNAGHVAPLQPRRPRRNNLRGGRTLGAPEGELDPILANDTPQEQPTAPDQEDEDDGRDEEEQEHEEEHEHEAPASPPRFARSLRDHLPNNHFAGHNIPPFGRGNVPRMLGPYRNGLGQLGEGIRGAHRYPRGQMHDRPGGAHDGQGLPAFGEAPAEGQNPLRRDVVNRRLQRRMFNHPGRFDPLLGHGPPMGFENNATSFDIVGPGRRLGEEGEDTTAPNRNSIDLVEDGRFEEILQDQGAYQVEEMDHEDEDEDEDEEDVEMDPIYHDEGEEASAPSFYPTLALPDIECEICCEEGLSASDFPSGKITAVCKHETKVCFYCLETTISVQITDGVLGQLNCPSCPEKLSYEDIREYASPEVFQRYDYLLSRTNKDMFMCLRTNCGAGQIHTGGREQPMMICNACDFKICTYHGRRWHDGQTCAEFDADPSQIERLEEEEATARILAQDSRICPKCNQGVSKTEGCDHMKCRCGNAFCFICEAEWENIIRLGGYGHARTCPYHPQYVRKGKSQLDADGSRALHAVHGGVISEELLRARAAHHETRRVSMRPLAAEAAEKRMKQMQENQKDSTPAAPPKKRKINLKAPWEEGGHSRRTL